MIVSMGSTSPQSIRKQLQKDTNGRASVQILGPDFDLSVADRGADRWLGRPGGRLVQLHPSRRRHGHS